MIIFLADDQPDVRSALRLLLEQQEDVEVAGEVASASELMECLADVRCDVLLVDWDLPGLPRGELMARAEAANPPFRVIALTTESMVEPGVAFVSKCEPPRHLLRALGREVLPQVSHAAPKV
jgi:DNA-binding NarL/FixJ family response regulator